MTKEKQKAFTLVETLVAITIILIAVLGPMSIFSKFISDTNSNKNKLIGYYLAQEGLELTMNKVINNISTNAELGLAGLGSCEANNCSIDFNLTASPCDPSQPDGCRLYFGTDSQYTHTYTFRANKTIYKRYINVKTMENANADYYPSSFPPVPPPAPLNRDFKELQIKSTVSWTEKGQGKNIEIYNHLFNNGTF